MQPLLSRTLPGTEYKGVSSRVHIYFSEKCVLSLAMFEIDYIPNWGNPHSAQIQTIRTLADKQWLTV